MCILCVCLFQMAHYFKWHIWAACMSAGVGALKCVCVCMHKCMHVCVLGHGDAMANVFLGCVWLLWHFVVACMYVCVHGVCVHVYMNVSSVFLDGVNAFVDVSSLFLDCVWLLLQMALLSTLCVCVHACVCVSVSHNQGFYTVYNYNVYLYTATDLPCLHNVMCG